MRVFGQCVMGACLGAAVVVGAQGPGTGPADAAGKVLAAAREALGGEKKLAAVTSFVVTGRTRQVRGDNLVPIEFEIAVELPDKYVRKDEIPAQESGPTSTGFNGDGLIQLPPAPPPSAMPVRAGGPPASSGAPPGPGRPAGPPADPRVARLNAVKQDFVRLTLGMFASSFSSYPLSFTYFGKAEAPQGKADVIDAKGPGTFAVRFFVNEQTHLPIMLSWQVPPTNVILIAPGQPPPATVAPGAVVAEGPAPLSATATQEDKDKYMKDVADARRKAMAKLVENRIYYADYRDADGLQFPFRIRKAVGADTIEETVFDKFKINPKIDPKKFEVIK
jgi:hypothetical protein